MHGQFVPKNDKTMDAMKTWSVTSVQKGVAARAGIGHPRRSALGYTPVGAEVGFPWDWIL